MQVYLIHNPGAGQGSHEEEWIRASLEEAGHQVVMLDPRERRPLDPDGLIAVAGGDGTVAAAARLYCDSGLPMTILPLGTANNIAASLGIHAVSALFTQRAGAAHLSEGALSVGRLSGRGRDLLFVEGVGSGLLVPLLTAGKPARAQRKADDTLHRRVRRLIDRLRDCPGEEYGLYLDGRDRSGRYLMVEILNTARVGPALELASGKDPGDGSLSVVLVDEGARERLADWLTAICEGARPRWEFPVLTAHQVELRCGSSGLHVDDQAVEGDGDSLYTIEAGVCRMRILK